MGRRRLVTNVALAAVAVVVIAAIGAHAFSTAYPYDFGIYYEGAIRALHQGRMAFGDGTVGLPFLAVVFYPITHLLTEAQAADGLTIVSMIVALALGAAGWMWLRQRAGVWAAWIGVAGWVGFAPLGSMFWWKQLDLVVLGFAVVALLFVRRDWWIAAGFFLGFAISLKLLIVFVPIAWLLWPRTRKAGIVPVSRGSCRCAADRVRLLLGHPATPGRFSRALRSRVRDLTPVRSARVDALSGADGAAARRVAV